MIEDEETGEQEICGAIETLQHALANCNSSREKFNYVKTVLETTDKRASSLSGIEPPKQEEIANVVVVRTKIFAFYLVA